MKKVIVSFLLLCIMSSGLLADKLSTYLVGTYMSVEDVKSKLTATGYEVIAEYEPVKNGTTIVFTNENLKKEASKPNRGHAAVLRVFVDDKEKMISITNPVYFGRAFMQDEYNDGVFSAELNKINGAFPGLKGSVDKEDDDDLEDYRYTMMNPRYHEFIYLDPNEDGDPVKKSNEEYVSKLQSHKKGKGVVFVLKVSDKTTLVGHDLGSRTKKFVEKIGRANAAVLPYCILLEDGKASALHGEYYLAVSYPLLSMGTFMTIGEKPGEIEKDLKKPFK